MAVPFVGTADLGLGVVEFARESLNRSFALDPNEDGPKEGQDDKGSQTQQPHKAKNWRLDPRRTVVIEPAFALMFTFALSSAPLTNQYIYWAIGEKYNLTELERAAEDRNGNGTSDRTSRTGCSDVGDRNDMLFLTQQKVQAESAQFNLMLHLISDVPGLLMLLFMGTLMDNFGRKPALILPLVGVLVQCSVYIIQQAAALPLETLVIGPFVNACCGGFGTFLAACYAYYSDTVPPADRGRRLIIADVIYGLILAVTQVLMGHLIQSLGFLFPYVIVMAAHLTNLAYVIFFVPESRPPQKNKTKAISPRYIIQSFKILVAARPNRGRRLLLLGVGGWGVAVFSIFSRFSVQTLFLLNSPLCWTSILIGNWGAFSSLVTNAGQMLVAIVLLRRLTEYGCVLLSLTSSIGCLIVLAFSSSTWMVFIAPVVGFAQGASMPVMRAILSNLVSLEEQGGLFSTIAAISSVLAMVGSVVFNIIYAWTLFVFKGTAFLVMAACLFVSMAILGVFSVESRKRALELQSRLSQVPQDPVITVTL